MEGDPALVRLAPAVVGPPAAGLVSRRDETLVRGAEPSAPDGDGWEQSTDVLDTWFSSALWPFATLGWPDDTPELRACYPGDVLSTARDIINLWVARMIMTGIEFAGDIPFTDVYIHSMIQAADGRRMSKSLGTGIDPLEPDRPVRRRRDALRAAEDVLDAGRALRRGHDRRGPRLANKLWNASRLVLLGAAEAGAAPGAEPIDRWILARLNAVIDGDGAARGVRLLARGSSCTGSSGTTSATGTSRRQAASTATTRAPRVERRCTCSSACWRCCIRSCRS